VPSGEVNVFNDSIFTT